MEHLPRRIAMHFLKTPVAMVTLDSPTSTMKVPVGIRTRASLHITDTNPGLRGKLLLSIAISKLLNRITEL
jgi:hypothetical protein